MKKSIMLKWVKALRSGKYKKGIGQLCLDNKYCCLGVLSQISGIAYERKRQFLSNEVMQWAELQTDNGGYSSRNYSNLADLNDKSKKGFKYIANVIEKHYKEL